MSSVDAMTIVEEPRGDALVLRPVGDVDLSRSPAMRERLTKAIASPAKKLIVDLSKVPYMDSSGVATLVEALQHCRKAGKKLVLAALQPKVRSIFEIAKLTQVFEVVDRVDAAGA